MGNIEDKRRKLYSIAVNQQGYFTAKQAISCGYSHRIQHYHKNQGHWIEIERGFFRLSNFPASEYEDFVRWSFWSRNREDKQQAVISHESALAVHELGDVMPSKVHLTVPPKFRKESQEGCVIHKQILKPDDVEQRDGFMITTPLRTIVDVAEDSISEDYLEQAVRDAFNKGVIVPASIIQAQMSKKAKEKFRTVLYNIKKNPIL